MDPNKPAITHPAGRNPGETSGTDQQPPLYQDYNAPYNPPPGLYPNQSAYPYGALYGQPYQVPYQGGPVVPIPTPVFITSNAVSGPVPDHLSFSIFTMLLCCFPLGVVALLYSIKTQNASRAGNRDEAEKYSGQALTMNRIALRIGVVILSISATLTVLIIVMRNRGELPMPTFAPITMPIP